MNFYWYFVGKIIYKSLSYSKKEVLFKGSIASENDSFPLSTVEECIKLKMREKHWEGYSHGGVDNFLVVEFFGKISSYEYFQQRNIDQGGALVIEFYESDK